jgi:hypothetical protein
MSSTVLLRRISVSLCASVAIIVGLLVWAFVFPPVHKAEHVIEASRTRITMQFTPSHPYLAEYDRSVEVAFASGTTSRIELFPDSGGYARSQLYEAPDGSLFVKGYFDVAQVNQLEGSILVNVRPVPKDAKYLGAFDYVQDVGFRFVSAEESAEDPLVVR